MYDQGFRKAALKMYNYLGNMKKVAKALNIGAGTIWRWIHNGIIPLKRQKTPFADTLVAFVKCSIEKSNHLTQFELINNVKVHLGVTISRKCLSSVLKILQMTRKRLRKRGFTNKTKYSERVQSFKESIQSINKSSLISIDEIGFDQRMTPLYGYSIKGTKAIGLTHPTNRKRTNVIMAIDATGKKYYEAIEGSVNANTFKRFIENLPWPKSSILIMDNVAFHKSLMVKEVFKDREFTPLFIPPYCNPIENIFSVVKNHYRKLSTDFEMKQIECINQSIERIPSEFFGNCFERMISMY